jgi:hypothetical protein
MNSSGVVSRNQRLPSFRQLFVEHLKKSIISEVVFSVIATEENAPRR